METCRAMLNRFHKVNLDRKNPPEQVALAVFWTPAPFPSSGCNLNEWGELSHLPQNCHFCHTNCHWIIPSFPGFSVSSDKYDSFFRFLSVENMYIQFTMFFLPVERKSCHFCHLSMQTPVFWLLPSDSFQNKLSRTCHFCHCIRRPGGAVLQVAVPLFTFSLAFCRKLCYTRQNGFGMRRTKNRRGTYEPI